MEIRMMEELTGHEWKRKILNRWGSRAELKNACDKGDHLASADQGMLNILDQGAYRLDDVYKTGHIIELDEGDIERLTAKRLILLEEIGKNPELTVVALSRLLGRDKKNVSMDASILASLGLLDSTRVGRETRLRTRANEMHIKFGTGSAPGPRATAKRRAARSKPVKSSKPARPRKK